MAVVSISAPAGVRLPSIPLSDCSRLRVGEWAISMGNPLGLNNSVSLGVVSSLKPELQAGLDWVVHDYLQTDAAINTGNSGGPLLNERGEAIGIVTAKAGGISTEGVGFAIPMGRVLPLLPSLLRGERVPHAMLGLQLTDVFTQAAELVREEHELHFNDTTPGALIMNVLPSSPAATASLQSGDLIVAIGGRRITSVAQVQQAIAASAIQPGIYRSFELGVRQRSGQQRSVQVTPVDFDEYSRARKEEEQQRRLPSRRLILMP